MRTKNLKTPSIFVGLLAGLMLAGCAGLRVDRSLRPRPYDWLMYGGSEARTQRSFTEVAPPLERRWEYNALGGITASPLVRDSVVLVATLHGELQAVNLSNGKRIGYVVLESSVAGTPAWDGLYAYVPLANAEESLVCLSLTRAQKAWGVSLGPIESSPLLLKDRLYVTTLDGIVYCVKKQDGMEVWKFESAPKAIRKPIRSSPATDGRVLVFGSDEGTIFGLDIETGRLLWKHAVRASIFASTIIQDGKAIVGALDGVLHAVDVTSGKHLWLYETGSKIYGSAAANAEKVFVGSADGVLHAIDVRTGKEVWRFQTKSVINSAPLVAGGFLYFGSLDRTLYTLRTDTGEEVWRLPVEGRIKVPPVLWGRTLLVTYEDKYIAALKPLSE
jgi:outer membrane protein assembly factor BamB